MSQTFTVDSLLSEIESHIFIEQIEQIINS